MSIALIQEIISSCEMVTDIGNVANNAATGMALLQPCVVSQLVQIPEKREYKFRSE